MNTNKVSSFNHQKPNAEPDVVPYFTSPARISAVELWGSYLKPAFAGSRASEAAGKPDVAPYFSLQAHVSTAALWGSSLKSALVFLTKEFRPFRFRTAQKLQPNRG